MDKKYYVIFIEQIVNDDYSEYMTSSRYSTHQQAQVAYFEKMKNVSAAIGNTHYYCLAEIRDSFGNRYENNILGKRVMPEPTLESEV